MKKQLSKIIVCKFCKEIWEYKFTYYKSKQMVVVFIVN